MSMYQVIATKDLPKSIGDGMQVYAVSRNDGKKGKSGIVCVAPAISEAVQSVFEQSVEGKAFIADGIATLRSKIISKLHAANKVITDDVIGMTALLAMAKAETESQRMTKEAIGNWFDSDLAQLVADAISAKFQAAGGIAADKVAKLVEAYKVKFQTLSQREVNMPQQVKEQLTKAVALLPDTYESIIGEKVLAALDEAEEATETLAAL